MNHAAPAARAHGLDLLRCLSALAVVFIHTPDRLHDGAAAWAWQTVLPFPNAMFAVMAGYLMVAKPLPAPSEWLKRRAARLLAPYAVWTGVYLLLSLSYHRIAGTPVPVHGVRGWLEVVFRGGGGVQLWFLIFLFYVQCAVYAVLYALGRSAPAAAAPVRQALPAWSPVWMALLAAVGLGLFPRYGSACSAGNFLYLLGYVALGAAIGLTPLAARLAGRRGGRPLLAAGVAGVAVVLQAAHVPLPAFVATAIWFAAGLCYGTVRLPKAFQATSASAMGIYLVHVIFTTTLPMVADGLAWHVPALRGLQASLVIGGAAFLAAWGAAVFLRRLHWTAFLVR